MFYTPNIPHCNGTLCPIRKKCLRYEFSRIARTRGTLSYALFKKAAYDSDLGSCKNFISIASEK